MISILVKKMWFATNCIAFYDNQAVKIQETKFPRDVQVKRWWSMYI